MAFKRTLRAPVGASTLQLADGSRIAPDGSGFVRVDSTLTDDLLGAGYTLPEAAPRLVCCTTRAGLPYAGQSSGSQTFLTYRTRYMTLKTSRVSGLRLVYANTEMLTTGEVNGPANYTIKASVEVNGVTYPVFFGGKREALVEVGGFVVSDPVGVSIAPASEIFVRSRPLVGTLGEKWPTQGALETALGESYVTTDVVDGGSTGSNAANSFGPSAILGMVPTPSPSVVIMGSSSAVGQGDTASTPERDLGYLARMLSTNTGYCRMVRASQTALHFLTDNRRRLSLLGAINPSHVIYQLGTNDITNGGSFETVQARLLDSYNILAGMGFRVVATTFTPVVTSSDSYATLEGQTINANNDVRVAVNNWLRTVPAPLSGVLEIADVVESKRDSGKWKVDGTASKFTADGQHLTQFAHELVAAALAPDLKHFTL